MLLSFTFTKVQRDLKENIWVGATLTCTSMLVSLWYGICESANGLNGRFKQPREKKQDCTTEWPWTATTLPGLARFVVLEHVDTQLWSVFVFTLISTISKQTQTSECSVYDAVFCFCFLKYSLKKSEVRSVACQWRNHYDVVTMT